MAEQPKTVLALSQVFRPDPAAVGQHMTDACAELVRRGHRVRVLTSDRGYDDPTLRYARRESVNGVDVLRLPLSSFGKGSIASRLAAGSLFTAQSALLGAFVRDVDALFVTTAPPMCALAALVIRAVRNAPTAYWVMDLNPDQMIELGRVRANSPFAIAFDALNQAILSRASIVIALDRFMAERLRTKAKLGNRLEILPPWPHDDHLGVLEHNENPFRQDLGLEDKLVVMYSGNHGLASPVTTCLEAALRLQERKDIAFVFVGGGVGKREVDEAIRTRRPPNIVSLPYQPLERLKYTLSAADVHLVTVGDQIVGINHPCKIYGAMSVGRPILLNGPERCHASEIVEPRSLGLRAANDDVEGTVRAITRLADMPRSQLRKMGERARAVSVAEFSRARLLGRFADMLEYRLGLVRNALAAK